MKGMQVAGLLALAAVIWIAVSSGATKNASAFRGTFGLFTFLLAPGVFILWLIFTPLGWAFKQVFRDR